MTKVKSEGSYGGIEEKWGEVLRKNKKGHYIICAIHIGNEPRMDDCHIM